MRGATSDEPPPRQLAWSGAIVANLANARVMPGPKAIENACGIIPANCGFALAADATVAAETRRCVADAGAG